MNQSSGRQIPNQLAAETSPYLQQHAWNPVDWFPWGPDAFQKAKAEGKPIFLSIGYSACHWCHVMERESFENEDIAALLNEHYVSIKVDREERPEIDQIYMSAVQLITRRGGWPMSVFMTPDGRPYYGGTYWPPTSRMGMPGFRDILLKLHDYWTNKRDEVESSADQIVAAIRNMAAPVFEETELGEETLRNAVQELVQSADRVHGGFGNAPKFPHPMDIRMLLRGWQRFGDEQALKIARLTLSRMARGGIHDHLGGGFHRYSTDAHWLVPHFEKMLYDNALLVPAYLEMFQITGEQTFADVARQTLDYVLREMTSPEGAFYSTQDADSEGEEGKFFVWTPLETRAILGAEDAEIFNTCYDVTTRGNWEGKSILHLPKPLEELARSLNLSLEELHVVLQRCRQKLLKARSRRVPPARDEKILTAWNGMMISALAQAAAILHEPDYREAAMRAADFLLQHLHCDQERLLHCYKDGQARFQGCLDDYACLMDGLVDLFQVTSIDTYLQSALALSKDVLKHFWDADAGGFFYTAIDHEQLIARTKDLQDNATPSGNGMMAMVLARLGRMCDRTDLEMAATKTLAALSELLATHPRACGQALLALDFLMGPTWEIVLVDGHDQVAAEMWHHVWHRFLPRKVTLRWPTDRVRPEMLNLLEGKLGDRPSQLFICDRGVCQAPCRDVPQAIQTLEELASN